MKTIKHIVKDPNGIHARPAGVLVNTAKKFSSDITIHSDDKKGDCKRIFSVMGMSLKCGDSFRIEIVGDDEDAAEYAIKEALTSSGI
ncbi:MAG: HPr family phosphocarrier protein [Ruminococcaceae bacterium]|nr:HPr family phosphocarrier protein [Oscillospiraceae bacterium]